MQQTAKCLQHVSIDRPRFHPLQKLAELRRNNTLGQMSAMLVFVGLFFAIATDGQLPFVWEKLLFGVLFILDMLMIDWLIR